MGYAADYALGQSAAFQQQVQMSMVKAALAVVSEGRSVHPVLDAKRHTLAVNVLANPANFVQYFAMAVIEAGGLVTGATDAQIDAQMGAVWNGIAGVSAADAA